MAKTLKHYTIRHMDARIELETDQKQNGSFMILLRTLFKHLYEKRPELLAEYVRLVNRSYELCNVQQPDDSEIEDFDFYNRLLQEQPLGR